jgi:hypothetical protein
MGPFFSAGSALLSGPLREGAAECSPTEEPGVGQGPGRSGKSCTRLGDGPRSAGKTTLIFLGISFEKLNGTKLKTYQTSMSHLKPNQKAAPRWHSACNNAPNLSKTCSRKLPQACTSSFRKLRCGRAMVAQGFRSSRNNFQGFSESGKDPLNLFFNHHY